MPNSGKLVVKVTSVLCTVQVALPGVAWSMSATNIFLVLFCSDTFCTLLVFSWCTSLLLIGQAHGYAS
jgi:hypothetical protein